MPPNPTVVKFGGLLVALGLFGMGPGSLLMDELRSSRNKKKKNQEEPQPLPESHLETANQEETTEQLKRRYSYTNSNHHPEADEFLSHPFQRAAAAQQQHSASSAAAATTSADPPAIVTPPETTPSWLSFLGPAPKRSE